MKQTQTTVKIATLTGAAKDDFLSGVTEDGGTRVLEVLANDPGAAKLYSLLQSPATLAAGAQFPVAPTAQLASGASIAIVDGQLVYDVGHGFQSLGAGATATDSFVYTVRMANGALSTATATVLVAGVNDPASISGDGAGGVGEDGTQSAGGTLAVSDVDTGENVFAPVAGAALAGRYGDFSFADGTWGYVLRNADANVQALNGGLQVSDTLVVTSFDGTATQAVTVTVDGANDPAAISGDRAGSVTEDGGQQSTGGTLAVSDVDAGENVFAAVAAAQLAGAYGDFTFDNGSWTYVLRNGDANVQALGASDSVTDSLVVGSLDGTASQTITVTIHGADEPVVIGDPVPSPDPVYQFQLNRNNVTGGESAIAFDDGVATLDYFTANDSVSWGNQDFTSIVEVNAGGDTLVDFHWATGKNSGTVTLLLVGVADVTISGNSLTMAP